VNFFERQDAARRQSKRLVFLFVLAVLAIVASVDVVFLIAFGGHDGGGGMGAVVLGTVLSGGVIGCASLFRMATLRSGGAAVAQQFGATPVPEDTSDFNLRRLRNVIEEIAIASGVPVPRIFVLDDEQSINAFAAGYSPSDAAITVTRGALDRLNRDELQGVIAHEYSHILNGDMRLNIRLIGLLFGILVLAIIGRKILQNGRFGRSRDTGALMLVAFGLLVIGYVGLFFGRLIKAGVSRQREYLADASAVQFTRQTTGLAGALKKLAGLEEGSKLVANDAEEFSHMLFGDGVGYSALMATHPPLLDRIRALEPSFKPQALEELKVKWSLQPPVGMDEDAALGFTTTAPSALPAMTRQIDITPPGVIAQVATPQSDDYKRAGNIQGAIPEILDNAARHHEEAVVMLLGLMHAPAGPVRDKQQYELQARMGARTAQQALDYADRLSDLNPMLRLPLASLAFPVLRRRPRPQLQQFMDTVYALAHADGEVDLFEYCLGRLLHTQVSEALDPSRAWVAGSKRLADVTAPVVTLLSLIAQAGHDNPADAPRAYLAGLARVYPRLNAPYAPPADRQAALEAAWPELDALEPLGKELLIEGLVAAISSDGKVTVAEAELLRTVCASLHCPLPPMLEQAEGKLA
jgi:Zn-dependent protease with chaperone function